MHFGKMAALCGLAMAAASCGQGNSDNVMSPEANALQPADVNAALGPEVTNTSDVNMTSNDMNTMGNSAANEAATNKATK